MSINNIMTPKKYYEKHFRNDFETWLQNTDAHQHPENQIFIPIQGLKKESLTHIDPNLIPYFIYSLTFTTLIDQVMYTYFKSDYPKFKSLTEYPKLEYGITNVVVDPWKIAQMARPLKLFESFCEFFIKDYEQFFTNFEFNEVNWQEVKNKMLEDKDINRGKFGEIFIKILKDNSK